MSEPLYIQFPDAATISGLEKDALRKRIARTIGTDKIIKQGRFGYLDVQLYRDLLSAEPNAQDPVSSGVQLYQRDRAGVLVPADVPALPAPGSPELGDEAEATREVDAEVHAEPQASSASDPAPSADALGDDASLRSSDDLYYHPDAATLADIIAEQQAPSDDDEASFDPAELEGFHEPDEDLEALIDDADERDHLAYEDDTLTISPVVVPTGTMTDPALLDSATAATPAIDDELSANATDYTSDLDPDIEDDEDDDDLDYSADDAGQSRIERTPPTARVAMAPVEVSDELAHARACREVIQTAIPDHDALDRYLAYLKAPQRTWIRRWFTKTEQPPPAWWRDR